MKPNNSTPTEVSTNTRYSKTKRRSFLVLKSAAVFAAFMLLSKVFAMMSTINGMDISEDYFSTGVPSIIGLFDSELFMGMIFVITLSVMAYVIYLLWQLHEIAVHKSERIKSHQVNLVFALSLCGLFLHKGWWVLAVIIAFTNWVAISKSLSAIIGNGIAFGNNREGDKK